MLSPIREVFHQGLKIRIKKTIFEGIREPAGKPVRKAVRYVDELKSSDVLTGATQTGNVIKQSLGDSARYFLGITWEGLEMGPIYITSTSTGNSLSSVLRSQAKHGPVDFSTISGMCLFGSGVDRLVTNRGRDLSVVDIGASAESMHGSLHSDERVVQFRCGSKFSFYEQEKTLRLTSFLQTIRSRRPQHGHSLVLPRIQYYFYLADLYNSGQLPGSVYLEWFDLVDERATRVFALFEEACGLGVSRVESSLQGAEAFLRDQVKNETPIHLDQLLPLLASGSAMWRKVLSVVRPATWHQLIGLSYVVSFSTQANMASRSGEVMIHVDDPLESVILGETARINKKVKRAGFETSPFIGLYLLQQLAQSDVEQESSLYDYRPVPADYQLLEKIYSKTLDGDKNPSRHRITVSPTA